MNQLNFFSPLDSEKRTELLTYLGQAGSELRIKLVEQYYKSKILQKKTEDIFSIYKFIPGKFQKQEAIFSFDGPDGKYFFKSAITTENSELTLKLPEEIFKLSRRNDFRIDLHTGNGYACLVASVNRAKKSIAAELRNISMGGLQVALAASELAANKDDEIELDLTIKDFEWKKIKTIAKQVRVDNKDGDVLILGLQYKDPEADFLTEIQSALMYLDRVHRHRQ